MTPEAIVDSAVRQGLTVIALTDHNSNANVQRAIDHTHENYEGRILVLPGVEVTTAHGHLLAYFAPDRVAETLQNSCHGSISSARWVPITHEPPNRCRTRLVRSKSSVESPLPLT